MNELTAEWVDKAEGDFDTARRELRVRHRPNYDAVCFHAQQTAEKYLKAFLQERAAPPPQDSQPDRFARALPCPRYDFRAYAQVAGPAGWLRSPLSLSG
jgi:HEPN domain-containing protein